MCLAQHASSHAKCSSMRSVAFAILAITKSLCLLAAQALDASGWQARALGGIADAAFDALSARLQGLAPWQVQQLFTCHVQQLSLLLFGKSIGTRR